MTTYVATGLIEGWLASTLSTDSQLLGLGLTGVYKSIAPPGSQPPWIVLIDLSGVDTTAMAATYVLTTAMYAIRVTVESGEEIAVAGQMANRIKALLQGVGPGAYLDGYIYSAKRTQVHTQIELREGVQWRHVISTFEIVAQEGS